VTFRDCDIIGRLGGDELSVLAVNCIDTTEIQKRLVQHIESFNSKKSTSVLAGDSSQQ